MLGASLAAVALALAQPAGLLEAERPFDRLRELHLAAYESDFLWQRAFERETFRRSGIDLAHGSISQHELFTQRRILVNVPAGRRVHLRFDREETGTGDLVLVQDRLEMQVAISGTFALTISAFPGVQKERIPVGAGFFFADKERLRWIDLRLQFDEPFFNSRTPDEAHYQREPRRVVLDTNLERGAFRLRARADLGTRSRLVYTSAAGSGGVANRERQLRRTEAKLEWSPSPWVLAGLRHRWLSGSDDRRHFPEYADPEGVLQDRRFAREEQRGEIYGDVAHGAFRLRGQVGGVLRREETSRSVAPSSTLERDELLGGARVHRVVRDGFLLGAGYWGSVHRIVRRTSFASRDEGNRTVHGYLDKVDAVAGYALSDLVRVEAILSHQIARGRFGGGGLKAKVLF